MKVAHADQYNSNCIVIQPGDSFEDITRIAIAYSALCFLEGAADYVVQFPGRPPEIYSDEALERSMRGGV
jgi:hypothetical protein